MLDLRRVRVFLEVAERQSFSGAAEALDYTQPSVSHHIAALEAELGQRLLNRATRPLTLTGAGRILHRAAVVAIAEFDRAELDLRSLAEGASGRVSLGSVVTGLRNVVPSAVRTFRGRFPNVDLSLEELQSVDVLARLRSGRLDIGIISVAHDADPPEPGVFDSWGLAEQPLMVALASGHRLAGSKRIALDVLRDEQWLLPSPARFPEFRAELDGLLAEAGLTSIRALESTDDIAGARLVAAGVAVGIAPELGSVAVAGVTLVALRPTIVRRLYAVTIAGRMSTPVAALLDDLRAASKELRP